MKNTTQILERGFMSLVENLGVIDAEYFISLIKREDFDYIIWQRAYFDNMVPGEFAENASRYANEHPYTGNGQIL